MNGIFVILKADGDGARGQGDRIGQQHSGEGRCEIRLKMDDDRFKLVPGRVDHLKDCHICLQDFRYQNEYIVNQQKEPFAKHCCGRGHFPYRRFRRIRSSRPV